MSLKKIVRYRINWWKIKVTLWNWQWRYHYWVVKNRNRELLLTKSGLRLLWDHGLGWLGPEFKRSKEKWRNKLWIWDFLIN